MSDTKDNFVALTASALSTNPQPTEELTISLLEQLIKVLVTHHSSMLRLRGFRLLSDLPAVSPGGDNWCFSQQLLQEARTVHSSTF